MALIRVFYKGALVSNFSLDGLKECRIGRDTSADINLQNDVSISRTHLVLTSIQNTWVVECKAKSKLLFKEGQQVSSIRLTDGDKFSIPSYEFEFADLKVEQNSTKSKIHNDEKTNVGMLPSIPTIVKYDSLGQVLETISMNGNAWIVGRDQSNSVYIDHAKLSRRHFEIIRKDGRFLIRDLGSANGTFVNGRALSQSEWANLYSGDEISVFDLKLRFVLRDASFDERVQQAQNFLSPFVSRDNVDVNQDSTQNNQSQEHDHRVNQDHGSVEQIDRDKNIKAAKKTKLIRFSLIAVILLVSSLYFLMNESSPTSSSDPSKILSPFEKLSEEQQQNVKQLYQSAQNFLQQGKYELTRQEIIKLHQIIPFYEDSKQIEETANQGVAMLQERERLEAEAKEREVIQEKIKNQIIQCRGLINPKVEMFELDLCLAPILEFDPAHPDIASLRAEVQRILDERAIREAQKRAFAEKVAQLKRLYEKAESFDKSQDWLKAIPAYQDVFSSSLPDPNGLKARARARREELQQMLLQKQAEVEQRADEAYKSGDLKSAIKILREGILINVENQVILGRHEEWMGELKRSMMPIYQESILEESVGEVDAAKLKWEKITQLSLPGEDYFEKAKLKLKRYGSWK